MGAFLTSKSSLCQKTFPFLCSRLEVFELAVLVFEVQTSSLLQVNTFQAVIGYDESDSYALFLYPEGGLNFFGTRPKVN